MRNGGLILGNTVAICKMYKTFFQTGETLYIRRFGESFKGPKFLSGVRFQFESNQDFTKLAKKVSLGIFHGYELIAGEVWKGNFLIADLENFEKLDASKRKKN